MEEASRARFESLFRRVLNGESVIQETDYQGCIVKSHYLPIRDSEGQVILGMVVSQDVTAYKKAHKALKEAHDKLELRVQERTDELKKRNRELQDFAFIASHDLREPLRKIRAFGDILAGREDSFDEDARDYLRRMRTAATRMRTLLDSLLTYSRVTTRAEPIKKTDLRKSVEEAVANLEVMIKEKHARVEVGDLPSIRADPIQMIQLFQNLIGNAIKFSRHSESAHVRIHAREAPADKAFEIYVEDNGIGFEEKYIDRIFDPFQRLHGRSSGYEGVGMGLAICNKIVERYGGRITARSAPGRGSTFIVTLPAT
jgi:light-regulated signal transduction histidine kinase (bacteriophytochrome)